MWSTGTLKGVSSFNSAARKGAGIYGVFIGKGIPFRRGYLLHGVPGR